LPEPHRGNSRLLSYRDVLASISHSRATAFGYTVSLFSHCARFSSRQQTCGCTWPSRAVSRGTLVRRPVFRSFRLFGDSRPEVC